jgi:16S rRNA (guanine527-N7)-methyltransferase
MRPDRIAELLEPFLGPAGITNVCHSEPGQRPGEEPALLPANDRSQPALSEAKGLTTNDLEHISTYIDILLHWNARINLTAIRDPEQIVTRHFGESLFAARHLFRDAGRQGKTGKKTSAPFASSVVKDFDIDLANDQRRTTNDVRVADLGSGAGFPGLPIKLWAPHISLTLIESNHKKATFLREVTRALTLTDVNIQTARAESLAGTAFDVVTLRAVERFESTLPVAASLLAPGGRLTLLIGSAQADQARSALPNLSWSAPKPVPLSRSRVLLVAERKPNQES